MVTTDGGYILLLLFLRSKIQELYTGLQNGSEIKLLYYTHYP